MCNTLSDDDASCFHLQVTVSPAIRCRYNVAGSPAHILVLCVPGFFVNENYFCMHLHTIRRAHTQAFILSIWFGFFVFGESFECMLFTYWTIKYDQRDAIICFFDFGFNLKWKMFCNVVCGVWAVCAHLPVSLSILVVKVNQYCIWYINRPKSHLHNPGAIRFRFVWMAMH